MTRTSPSKGVSDMVTPNCVLMESCGVATTNRPVPGREGRREGGGGERGRERRGRKGREREEREEGKRRFKVQYQTILFLIPMIQPIKPWKCMHRIRQSRLILVWYANWSQLATCCHSTMYTSNLPPLPSATWKTSEFILHELFHIYSWAQ